MNNKCDGKLLETVAFSNVCICFVELIQWEHTHFHPSGSLVPSKGDTVLTDRMIELCGMMEIPLLDYVIVGGDNREYFSFREKGILKTPHAACCTDYREIQFESGRIAERSR